jgi:hypothetical protein
MVMTKNEQQLLDVQSKLDRLCIGIDMVQLKQEEMSDDVAKIKEAVYNPDNGLYARLRELETWKSTSSKMIWILLTSVIGLICAFILKGVQ